MLNYTVWSTSWHPGDWSHSHFNCWYNHIVNCRQNCVMDLIFDCANDNIYFFSKPVDNIFSMTWLRLAMFSASVSLPRLSSKPSFWGPAVSSSTIPLWAFQPIRKSFKDSFNWLRSFLFWCFVLLVEIIFVSITNLCNNYEINGSTTN